MTCDEALGLVVGSAAGEIAPGDRHRLDGHLSGCAACAVEAARLAAIMDALRREKVPDPGASYWDAYNDRLRQRIAADAGARRFSPARLLAAAAALLLAAGVALVVEHRRGSPTPPVEGVAAVPEGPSAPGAGIQEPDLDAILERAAESRDPGTIGSILDDMLERDPWDPDGALSLLSSEERAALARSLAAARERT